MCQARCHTLTSDILDPGAPYHRQRRRDQILRFEATAAEEQEIIQEYFSQFIPPPQEGELRSVCLKETFYVIPWMAAISTWLLDLPGQAGTRYFALANGLRLGLSLADSIYTFSQKKRLPVVGKALDLYAQGAIPFMVLAPSLIALFNKSFSRRVDMTTLAIFLFIWSLNLDFWSCENHLEREVYAHLEWANECSALKNCWEQEGTPTTYEALAQREHEARQWAQRSREHYRNDTPLQLRQALHTIVQPLVAECIALPVRAEIQLGVSITAADVTFNAIDQQEWNDPVASCEAYETVIPSLPHAMVDLEDFNPFSHSDPSYATTHNTIHAMTIPALNAYDQLIERYRQKLAQCAEENLNEGQAARLEALRSRITQI